MAIHRPLIDVIDAGLDPRIAHSRLSKQGHLIKAHEPSGASVLSIADMKEHLLVNDKKDVLTEGDENQPEEFPEITLKKIQKSVVKPSPAKPVEAKKTDKTPKPV